VAQLGFGTLFFLVLPASVQSLFLGGNIWTTAVFWLSILCALAALHFAFRSNFMMTLVFALLTVVLMVINRSVMRAGYLAIADYSPENLEVGGDLSPFILFAVTLVIGLVIIYWMVRTYINSRKEA